MFSGFFGKGDRSDKTPPKEKDALDSRGLEVVEDDPDTAWGLWDSALAAQDSRFHELPSTADSVPPIAPQPSVIVREQQAKAPDLPPLDGYTTTQPLALEEKSLERRKEDALAQVDLHHHRIANTIRSMWGYKECGMYLNKLIMDGGDGMGKNRIGFNQDAVEAMLVLVDLHDKQFGISDAGLGLGFGDPTVRTGFDGLR